MFKSTPVISKRNLISALLLAGLACLYSWTVPATAQAVEPVFQARGVAIRGYDTLAYFTEERAVRGKKSIKAEWNGATWYFASAANRDKFLKSPEQYAPQYGGYCAFAVAQNQLAPIDPQAWTIEKDKLYLNYSVGVRATWLKNLASNIKKGDRNFPALIAQ